MRKATCLFLDIVSAISIIYASECPEFVFASNIPAYVPFESTLHALVEERKEHLSKKRVIPEDLKLSITEEFSRLATAELEHIEAKEAEYSKRKKKIKNPPIADDGDSSDIEYIIRDNDSSKQWRGAYTSYDLKKQRVHIPTLNTERDAVRVSKLIELFANESFDSTNEASQTIFEGRMCLAILANRPKSVLSAKNSSLKTEHNDPRGIVIKGAWAPQWEYRKGKGKYSQVTYDHPKKYVRYCLKKWQAAKSPEEKEKWQNKVIAVLEQEHHVSRHVPYRELRETLRESQKREERIRELQRLYPKARIYEATHDSDLTGLRTKTDSAEGVPALGLYSYYTRILTEYFQKHHKLPEVATTGYRAVYEPARYLQRVENEDEARTYYAWIYQAIEDDRYARAAASEVDFRASYISEPNALFLVPTGSTKMPYSFLGQGKDSAQMGEINTYDPKESMLVLSQIYGSNPEARILFDSKHPVWMKVPDRMLQYKTSKTDFDIQQFGSFHFDNDRFFVKDLEIAKKFATRISQTPFAYRDYAITLYAQFGLRKGNYKYNEVEINYPNNLFKSLVCSMFYYYEQPAERRTLLFTYDGKNVEVIKKLKGIENGAQLAALISQIYGLGVGEAIRNIAKKIAAARQAHHSAFFLEDSPERSSRTSVRSSIERSPHREDNDVTQGSLARSSEEMGVSQSEDAVMNHKYTSRDIARLFKQVLVEENQNPLATFTLDGQDNPPVENLVFIQGNTCVLPPLSASGLLIDSIKTLSDHPSAQTHQLRMILVPYNPGGHWVTLRINILENRDMTIEYIDSLINEEEAVNQSRIESASDFMRNLIDLLKQQIPAFSNRTITQAVITPRVQYNEIDCGALTVANVIDSVNGVPLLNDYRMNPDEIKTIKEHHRSKLQQMGEDFEFEEGHQKKVKLPVGGTHSDRETSPEPQKPTMSSQRVFDSTQSVSTNSSQKSSSRRKFDRDEIALYARNNPRKTQKEIAEHFGCSTSTVSRAINGK